MNAGQVSDEERLARAALTRIVEPATEVVVQATDRWGAAAVWAAVQGRDHGAPLDDVLLLRLRKSAHLAQPERDLADGAAVGARLVCPGDAEWPPSLAVLGREEPIALWLRGQGDLAELVERSVAVVGARTATAYGGHVASEMGYGLAGRGWTVVSGGAFGVDSMAHRGALAASGVTIAVLACGVDVVYPRPHDRLFARILEEGLLISEWPPGASPRPRRFLVRNRVIAAMTAGTVVVEAAVRSGAVSTAHAARKLGRPLMVVPGPVTSTMSAGCHVLLREEGSLCVTSPAEVIEEVGRIGDDLAPRAQGEVRSRDALGPVLRGVLEAVPSQRPVGPAVLASRVGLEPGQLRRSIGELVVLGFVELTDEGYRLSGAERAAVRARRKDMQAQQLSVLPEQGALDLAEAGAGSDLGFLP
jgi:DNA processing protein